MRSAERRSAAPPRRRLASSIGSSRSAPVRYRAIDGGGKAGKTNVRARPAGRRLPPWLRGLPPLIQQSLHRSHPRRLHSWRDRAVPQRQRSATRRCRAPNRSGCGLPLPPPPAFRSKFAPSIMARLAHEYLQNLLLQATVAERHALEVLLIDGGPISSAPVARVFRLSPVTLTPDAIMSSSRRQSLRPKAKCARKPAKAG